MAIFLVVGAEGTLEAHPAPQERLQTGTSTNRQGRCFGGSGLRPPPFSGVLYLPRPMALLALVVLRINMTTKLLNDAIPPASKTVRRWICLESHPCSAPRP
ncbi:hypothetical protein C8R46DRAFT_993284 [Mycena filopes]|nr:hypothetical protein C8R46DRAFT_993284 [Mycena filopes]